ncbi:dirigent protein 17-like [Cornus florida]|uniref:dirigent protein 17-like n=1 Tax=Cornus florida TaxID=4283 RepID=UPI0028A196BC|nr:dirigent protein 17-like [Cornus florida]XP_059667763.1 dirigent protein 17-like [Cornus florida]XP_059667764.1 dirigent protein 17-like [Cornus florida]
MENEHNEDESESISTGVFELSGEPAVVINGVPPVSPNDGTLVLCGITSDVESHRNVSFGEWLVGREVRKLFGEQLYNGKVTEFDKESGWYRVVYEDGDFEDLEWHELEEILLPLDITVPLKTLALKIIKKRQRPIHRSGKRLGRAKNYQATRTADSGGSLP